MTYRASLDTLNKILTWVVFAGLLFMAGLVIYFLLEEAAHPNQREILAVGTLLLAVALFISYGFSPKAYTLTKENLVNQPPHQAGKLRLSQHKGSKPAGIRHCLDENQNFWRRRVLWILWKILELATRTCHPLLNTFRQ